MPESERKRCLVALDAAAGPVLIWMDLPADATVGAALAQARRGAQADAAGSMIDCLIDWDGRATGLWGVRCERSAVPRDGDRVELYLPLPADPRQRRRQRAGKGRPGARGRAR